jgi:hypothetical protein
MSLKQNINKIHGESLNLFEKVNLTEKSKKDIGNYFEMVISEGNKDIKLIIKKSDIINDNFSWVYYSNPNDDNSILVERNSNIDNFCMHLIDIFEKNRFDNEYLKSINN